MMNRIETLVAPLALASALGGTLFIASGAAAPRVTVRASSDSVASADEGRTMIGIDAVCMAEVPGVPMSLCFAPGTPAEEITEVTQRLAATWANDLELRDAAEEGGVSYELGTRWVINGSSAQGAPVTLRWSMPADGLSISDGVFGGAASPNNLNATFTTKFGSVEAGKNLLRQVFQRWADLSGISYTEVTDDGASFPNSSGGATRGDIRIVGRTFGATGVLAYNYFPNNGDMVIVTSNSNSWSAANNNRYFRNIIAHEHGHGLGFDHVCPTSQTKLMEPLASSAFDGPQADDIRCVQRAYGDNYEPNDTAATATTTALNASGTTSLLNVSLDDNLDVDFFKFTATAGSTINISLQAPGTTYLSGPQNANGSCSAGTSLNSRTIHNMDFQVLRGATGSTVVTTVAAAAAGSTESVTGLLLPATDTYFIRVFPSTTTDDIQMYTLVTTINLAPETPGDVNNDGIVNGADLGILLASWGPVACGSIYDLNGSCTVDGADLGILLANWG